MHKEEIIMLHRVAFLTQNCVCRIVPGHIVVGVADRISFSAIGSAVTVYFPNPNILEESEGRKIGSLVTINPGHPVVFTVVGSATNSYPYTAYCSATNTFATGGSEGEIIIQT
jgi:hypothetical protein